MVTQTDTQLLDSLDAYDEMQDFERMRPKRDGVMPVGSSRATYRSRKRNSVPKRTHRTPQHCRGAQHRRVRKWK